MAAVITFGDGTNAGYAEGDNGGGASTTVTAVPAWAQAAGDILIAEFAWDVGNGTLVNGGPTDTKGNVWVQVGTTITDTGNFFNQAMFVCLAAKVSAASANTITLQTTLTGGGAGSTSIAVFGFTAPGYYWVQDQFSHNRGTGTTTTPGAITTTYANSVLVAGTDVANSVTGSPGAPWNNEAVDALGGQQSYYIATSIQSSVNPSYTQATGVWTCQIASFAALLNAGNIRINQRAPGFPPRAPLPGIGRVGIGILGPPAVATASTTNVYPAGWFDPDNIVGALAGAPALLPAGSETLEARGASVVAWGVFPSGTDTGERGGAPLAAWGLLPAGSDTGEASGAPWAAWSLYGAGAASGEANGAQLVAWGLQPGGLATGEGVGPSFMGAGVFPSGTGTGEAIGGSVAAWGIFAAGASSGEGLGAIAPVPKVLPTGTDSGESAGALTLPLAVALSGTQTAEGNGASFAARAVLLAGIESAESQGAFASQSTAAGLVATVLLTQQRAPGFPMGAPIPGIVLLGTDLLIVGPPPPPATQVTFVGANPQEYFGAFSMAAGLLPAGVASSEGNGTQLVTPAVLPAGQSTLESFGAAYTLVVFAVGATGVPTPETFGSSYFTVGVLPGGQETLSGLGTPGPTPTVLPAPTVTFEALGAISAEPVTAVQPASLETLERFGAAATKQAVPMTGIAPHEPLGGLASLPSILPSEVSRSEEWGALRSSQVVGVQPSGLETFERFGSHYFGVAVVLPGSLPPSEDLGAILAQPGLTLRYPAAIGTLEVFGALAALAIPVPPPPVIAPEFVYPVVSVAPSGATLNLLYVARGASLSVPRQFLQNGAAADLTGTRVLFIVKRYASDPDAAAIATLDNQSLGGVVIRHPTYGHAQITMPASVTIGLLNILTILYYEIWLHDAAGNEWRTENGQIYVDARLPVSEP